MNNLFIEQIQFDLHLFEFSWTVFLFSLLVVAILATHFHNFIAAI